MPPERWVRGLSLEDLWGYVWRERTFQYINAETEDKWDQGFNWGKVTLAYKNLYEEIWR